MSIDLEEEIASLPALSKAELLKKWHERLKQAPPSHLNKPILVPLLAYRLQEQAFGGLKPAYKRRLRELADSFERNPSGRQYKFIFRQNQTGDTTNPPVGRPNSPGDSCGEGFRI